MVIRALNRVRSLILAVSAFIGVAVLLAKFTYKPYFVFHKPLVGLPAGLQNIAVRGEPYEYTDEIDFRIIVLTFKRSQSLLKLLESIDEIELDGDTGALEIWIDRDKQGHVDNKTIETAISFHWKNGPTRVYVHSTHVGIYGQWIHTWKPKGLMSKEIVIILEDDMNVSKYCYRWLKNVHRFYGKSSIFAGATLQSDLLISQVDNSKSLKAPKNDTAFMYKCVGTWGYSPNPAVWIGFQNWVRVQSKDHEFCPCVPGLSSTKWYKKFRKQKTDDSMWSVWFIYYTDKERLFTVYSNLNRYNGDFKSCLSINRRERGLHSKGRYNESKFQLLSEWKEEYVRFPESVKKLDWNGSYIEN